MNPDSAPLRFLIVDDDETFTRVLSRAIKRRGYETAVASSAEQALLLLDQFTPDLATLDLKMDGASGITLIPRLKDNKLTTVCQRLIFTDVNLMFNFKILIQTCFNLFT